MFLLFGFCLLFRALAFTEGVSLCSSSNSHNENMNILLQNSSGVIKTPGYPISYPYKLISQCRWKLIAPEGEMVRLTFLSFQMNIYDSVEITDNVDVWNPYFLTRSGLLPSFTVYSTGRQLGINVNVKVGNTGPGFSAIYSMVPAAVSSGTCNPDKNSTVHMAGEGMSFLTPRFPEYLGNGTCRWNITASPGKFVKLTFWSFTASGCKKTYAEVFDVTNSTRTFLGKFCFNPDVSEQVIYSKGNNLLVSGTFRQGGFIATYESVKSIPARYSCLSNCYTQIQLNETSGEFASFNYPLLYPNGARCSWELKAPAGYLIQLTFHSFNLENSQDCKADYVEVRQSESYTWATKVDRFCGSSLPPVMRSKYSKVYVDFVSDRSGGYPGFHASYTVFPDPAVGPCRLEGVDNVIPMTGDAGRLFSPQFPRGTTPRSRMCTWIITVPEGHFVKFSFTSRHFADTCRNTSLEIRDGESSSSDLLKRYCEWPSGYSDTLTFFSSSRHLWARFQSPKADWTWTWRFSAVFEAVTQLPASFSCTAKKRNFKLTSETGILASYNYPLPYDPDMVECDWIISVGSYKNIELSFDFFNLSGSTSSCWDHVEIGNGKSISENVLQRFCGSEKPSTVTSKGSALWVSFVTSGKRKYPGFKASYKSVASTVAILKVVAICVGVISLCVVVGIVGYKYYKSRRNQPMQRMYEDESDNVLL